MSAEIQLIKGNEKLVKYLDMVIITFFKNIYI